jgi:hypothetical protein
MADERFQISRVVTSCGGFMERYRARLRCPDMKRWIAVALVAAWPLAASADMVRSPRVPAYLPVPAGAAVILNTGSTNTAGYRIVVQRSGSVEYIVASQRASATVPGELAARLFSDLTAAGPLQDIASVPCMKSASFGTSLYVWWGRGGRSPDLSCAPSEPAKALQADASQIAQALHLSPGLRSPVVRPLMPGEQHQALPPTPSPSA